MRSDEAFLSIVLSQMESRDKANLRKGQMNQAVIIRCLWNQNSFLLISTKLNPSESIVYKNENFTLFSNATGKHVHPIVRLVYFFSG